MLPVSAWPPGPPGAQLSPFGAPRAINVARHANGYVLPKGAWVVRTGANQVVMFTPSWEWELYNQPCRAMGTGFLPGQWQWMHNPRPPLPPPAPAPKVYKVNAQVWRGKGKPPPVPIPVEAPVAPKTQILPQKNFGVPPETPADCRRPTHDQYLEAWRAWQRAIGRTDPPIRPIPGRVPPNWAGWRFVGAPSKTAVPFNSSGLVVADGQNVVITGGGTAVITQAYSV